MIHNSKQKRGFTLIEILVVMGIIAVLATIVLVAINPARQFAQSRDTQRVANINALLNAASERIADHKGVFEESCAAGVIPASTTAIASAGFNMYSCIVPTYISALPLDPRTGSFTNETNYTTGYTIMKDTGTGRIVISAPATEIASGTISVTR